MMVRYVAAWFPMIAIAVANGAFREAILRPRLGDLAGRQISTLMLVALLAAYIGMVTKHWPLASETQAVAVGAAWLVLTLAFEFALGRFVSRLTWREMAAEYNLAAGRLWILVPLWIALAPYVYYRL